MKNATHGEEAPAATPPPSNKLVVALVSDGIASMDLFASSDDGDDHIVKAYTFRFRLTIRSQSGNNTIIGTRVIQCVAHVSTSTGLVGQWRPIASTIASDNNQVPRVFQLASLASPSLPIAIAVGQAVMHQPEPESDPLPHRILPSTEGVYVFTGCESSKSHAMSICEITNGRWSQTYLVFSYEYEYVNDDKSDRMTYKFGRSVHDSGAFAGKWVNCDARLATRKGESGA